MLNVDPVTPEVSAEDAPCPTCAGRFYRRTEHGWQRCACYWAKVALTFIKPQIRGRDVAIPDQWSTHVPWPLEDRTETGDYHSFRYGVWASLLAYVSHPGFRYDYFDAYRLVEIQFGRDTDDYKTMRDLKDLSLLVLVIGVSDPRNEYLPSLIKQATTIREMYGRPTWMFRAMGGAAAAGPTVPVAGPVAVSKSKRDAQRGWS